MDRLRAPVPASSLLRLGAVRTASSLSVMVSRGVRKDSNRCTRTRAKSARASSWSRSPVVAGSADPLALRGVAARLRKMGTVTDGFFLDVRMRTLYLRGSSRS